MTQPTVAVPSPLLLPSEADHVRILQPLGACVLVEITPEKETTKSGLVLPDTAQEKPQRGDVVAIGEDDDLIKVAVGDRVLCPKYTGTEIRLENDDYLIIEATDLLTIVKMFERSRLDRRVGTPRRGHGQRLRRRRRRCHRGS